MSEFKEKAANDASCQKKRQGKEAALKQACGGPTNAQRAGHELAK